jgi:hypothetical protein
MKRTALICLLGFLAGIVATSTLPGAFADEKKDDEKKLKYPWAGKEWNQAVTMTKLDRLLLSRANEAPADDARVLEKRNGKPVTIVTKYEAKAARQGILLIVHVRSLRPRGVGSSELNQAKYLWYRKHLDMAFPACQIPRRDWPIECRLMMKGKVLVKAVHNAD